MYARKMNPIQFVGGRGRRRQAVGAEFFTCPDGTQVKNDAAGRALCGPAPTGGYTPSWPSGGGATGSGTGPNPVPVWGPTGGAVPTWPTSTPTIPTTTPVVTIPTSTPVIPDPGTPGPGVPWNPPGPGNTPNGCRPLCNPCPENQKRYYMPFVPQAGYTASVTAGSLVIFVGRPQKLFAPDRLIIGSTIGAYFDIVSLTIGNIPQSLSAGNVGAEMFSEVATYVMMTFDQAYPGIDIILTAQNKSSVTQTFQAQLVGEAVG